MNTLDAFYPRQVPTKDTGHLNGKARGGNEPESDRASQFASALSAHGKPARTGLENADQKAENETGEDDAAQAGIFDLFSAGVAEGTRIGDAETETDTDKDGQEPAEDISAEANAFAWPALVRSEQDTIQKTVPSGQPVGVEGEAKADAQPAETPAEDPGSLSAAALAAEQAGPAAQPAQPDKSAAIATISGVIPGKAGPGSGTTDKRGQNIGTANQSGSGQSRSGAQSGAFEGSAAEQAARSGADISLGGKERPGPVSPTAGERFASREKNGGRMERVQVVESRSFAGMTGGGNGEAVARTLLQELPPGPPAPRPAALTSAAAAALFTQPLKGQTLHTLKIQLNPLQLGQVTAVMRITGSELTVELKVETAQAFRQMNDDADAILKSLRGQGYGIEHISVQQVMSDRGATAQGGQAGASSGQQFQPGNGQGQTLASGGENGRRGESGGRGNSTGDRTDDIAANASGGTRTPDGVYL